MTISRKPHNWAPGRPKISHERLTEILSDTSKTLIEIAAETGYCENWLQYIASSHGIKRQRGGDRRSAAAKARYVQRGGKAARYA